jgi:hypothetical protein
LESFKSCWQDFPPQHDPADDSLRTINYHCLDISVHD